MKNTTTHFVTLADGFFGDHGALVISSHKSFAAAQKAARSTGAARYAVRVGSLVKGDVYRGAR